MMPEEEIDACQKVLGYEGGTLLENVTRYKAWATREIETLRAGGDRVVKYAQALQAKLSEKDVMEISSEALNEMFKGSPRTARDCANEKTFHDNLSARTGHAGTCSTKPMAGKSKHQP